MLAMFVMALVGCSDPGPAGTGGFGGEGGALVTSSSSSSAASSSSSSGTPFVPGSCDGQIIPLAPFNGDLSYPYFEDGAHACRRFAKGSYSQAFVGWSTGGPCTFPPRMFYAVASSESITGFSFVDAGLVPEDGIMPISANPGPGESLFVCAVLSVKSDTERSCVNGCQLVGDPDSFWSDTDAMGYSINPPVLESLSVSPTVGEAQAFGNNFQRLMIEAR